MWTYGACGGEGVCVPGTMGTLDCGACGAQEARCTDACGWLATGGACTGEGLCTPGAVQLVSTGCAPDEAREATCDSTCGLAATGACEPLVDGPHIVVPYMAAPSPARLSLGFGARIALADIYFLFDITGSMAGEIAALRSAVTTIVGDRACADSATACTSDSTCAPGEVCSALTATCIESAETSGCVPSLWTGTGYYETFYRNVLPLQGDPAATSSAMSVSTFGGTEELYKALTALADPAMVADEVGCTGPSPGFVGCPSFRSAARRIAVVFTDEDSDGLTTAMQAGSALAAQGITLIGIWSGPSTSISRSDLVDVVRESGSFQSDGVTPLVYDGTDAAVVPLVVSGIAVALSSGTVRVTVAVTDDPSDAVDALQFVDRIEVNTTGATCVTGTTEDTDGDGADDAFGAVPPGSHVCFDVVPRTNASVVATSSPQVYPVRVTISVDGTPAHAQVVAFIIPSQP